MEGFISLLKYFAYLITEIDFVLSSLVVRYLEYFESGKGVESFERFCLQSNGESVTLFLTAGMVLAVWRLA